MRLKFTIVLAGLLGASSALVNCCNAASQVSTAPVTEEVSWAIGGTTVSAAITIPAGRGLYPAVVFVPGSGPTDRDWNSILLPGTNGSALLLADELSRGGFVVLRYDKRFTGPNAKGNLALLAGKLSMNTHVEELAGAVALLRAREDVDPKRIFVLSNSEGAIHALNYQLQKEPKFAGLVLTSAPGRLLKDLMRSQVQPQVAALPNAAEVMEHYDKLVDNFLAGQPFAADPLLPESINQLMHAFYQPLSLPFARELFEIDPAALLGRVRAPALVLIGKKDIQVDWQADGALLMKAAGVNVSFAYPENADHVLKYEARPRSELTAADGAKYNATGRTLDTETLKSILDWLKLHAAPTDDGQEAAPRIASVSRP